MSRLGWLSLFVYCRVADCKRVFLYGADKSHYGASFESYKSCLLIADDHTSLSFSLPSFGVGEWYLNAIRCPAQPERMAIERIEFPGIRSADCVELLESLNHIGSPGEMIFNKKIDHACDIGLHLAKANDDYTPVDRLSSIRLASRSFLLESHISSNAETLSTAFGLTRCRLTQRNSFGDSFSALVRWHVSGLITLNQLVCKGRTNLPSLNIKSSEVVNAAGLSCATVGSGDTVLNLEALCRSTELLASSIFRFEPARCDYFAGDRSVEFYRVRLDTGIYEWRIGSVNCGPGGLIDYVERTPYTERVMARANDVMQNVLNQPTCGCSALMPHFLTGFSFDKFCGL